VGGRATLSEPALFVLSVCPARHAVLRNFEIFGGVMRAKGCFWTAAEPSTRIDYSLVGNTVNVVVNTVWSQVGMQMLRKSIEAGRFKDQAEHVEKAYQRLANEASRMKTDGMWDPVTHDRRVDLVFIGDIDVMDEDRIRAEIEGALLDPAELEGFLQGKGPKLEPGKNPFAQVPRCVKL
jgi:G3E family GTPase